MKAKVKYALPHSDVITEWSGNLYKLHNIEEVWGKESGFLVFPFDRKDEIFFIGNSAKELHDTILKPEGSKSFSTTSRAHYEGHVNAAKKVFDKKFTKVVLAKNAIINKTFNATTFLEKSNNLYPKSFRYCIDSEYLKWAGASPELLLSIKGETIETIALAGTMLLGNRFGEKERMEQENVQKFIEEKAEIAGLKCLKKSDTYESGYGKIKHLKTRYTFKGDMQLALTFAKQLHPTSATCGTPRKNGFDFIKENENFERKYYTGVMGVLTQDTANLFVNLRCIEYNDKECMAYIGAGITAQSVAENEWEETERKLEAIKDML